jgi:hypothetical protein
VPKPPVEMVDVADGQGVIEVVGDAEACMLLLAGDAVAVAGSDQAGSIGMLAARALSPATTMTEVKALTTWLADPGLWPNERHKFHRERRKGRGRPRPRYRHVPPPDPDRLRPLLELLRPGRYVLSAFVTDGHPWIVDGADRPTMWDYDAPETILVPTDHWPPRDGATVERYRLGIERDGVWPAVVTLSADSNSEVAYVLDGHHKLAAYTRAGTADLAVIQLTPEHPFRPRWSDLERVKEAFSAAAAPPLEELRRKAAEVGHWAGWLAEHGRYEEAAAEYRTDLANLRRMIAKAARRQPAGQDVVRESPKPRLRLAKTQHDYGLLLRAMGREADAAAELRSALAVRRHLLGDEHPATREARRALDPPSPD